jgi:hypothetical protein
LQKVRIFIYDLAKIKKTIMTEKIKLISNPLTIIAIFAALAEINATISIGLVDKSLQPTFIWFVILFPTLLIVLFFITLNFNTKVIYAPSDYKDDDSFHRMLHGEPKPDKEINSDTDFIKKTIAELGINTVETTGENFPVSTDANYLFSVRYTMEKELRRLCTQFLVNDRHVRTMPILMTTRKLVESEVLSDNQQKAIRNIYSITAPVVHGDDSRFTRAELEFVKRITPGLIDELKKIELPQL